MARRTKTDALQVPQRERIVLDPNTWPRSYQKPVLYHMLNGGDRAMCVWHRGAGKDYFCMRLTLQKMLQRPGNYYHLWPEAAQARKFLWDGIDEQGHSYLDVFPRELLADKPNETEMIVRLKPVGGNTTGSTWQLIGMDDPDRNRGINPAGVVLSEYSDMKEAAWPRIIEPRLNTNRGWAVFIFTPLGKNHAWKHWEAARANPQRWFTQLLTVDQTRKDAPGEEGSPVITREQLMEMRAGGTDDETLQQEYFCSFEGSLRGNVFADLLAAARKEGRVGRCVWNPQLLVKTVWDIGRSDGTAIIFYQTDGRMLYLIDYHFERGKGVHHFCHVVKETKPYVYNHHVAPHDIEITDWGAIKSRKEIAADLGVHFTIARKESIDEGIDAFRRLGPRLVIGDHGEGSHEGGLATGPGQLLEAMSAYRYVWDKTKHEFSKEPLHDWASHAGSACRYLGLTPCEDNDLPGESRPARYARGPGWNPQESAFGRVAMGGRR